MKWPVTTLVLLALGGVPLFIVLFALALVGHNDAGLRTPLLFVEIFNRLTSSPLFVTIPLFAFSGFVLSESGAAKRLVDLSRATLGWLPGGATVVTVSASSFFTAFTGASGVTIIALGGLLLPNLRREGYSERFNLGLLTTCGSVGLLFPPSLPVIVLALVVSSMVPISVESLFIACLLPGLLLVITLTSYGMFRAWRSGEGARVPFEWKAVWHALKQSSLEAPLPFVVVGGILFGVFTVTEAAAVVALWVTIAEVFIHRDITFPDLGRLTIRSMILSGALLIIVMSALALSNWFTDQEIPVGILNTVEDHIGSKLSFLLLLNLFLLGVGCLMDIYSALLVVVPLVFPVAMRFGIDPLHLSVIILLNLEIGYSTPPVGINLFIASLRFKRPVLELYRASLPFIGLMLIDLAIVTWLPALSLSPVRQMEGSGRVEILFKTRDSTSIHNGRGILGWSQRTSERPDPDRTEAPGKEHAKVSAGDVTLTWSPNQDGTTFDLVRFRENDWSANVQWNAPPGGPDALKPGVYKTSSVFLGPPTDTLPFAIVREMVTASEVNIAQVDGSRVRGWVRTTVLHFPDEPGAPDQVYDIELQFDITAVSSDFKTQTPGPGAFRFSMPDVVLKRTDVGFSLSKIRNRPNDIASTWTPTGIPLSFSLAMEGTEGWAIGKFTTLARSLEKHTANGDEQTGILRALLRHEESGRLYDVEVGFKLPVR